MGCDLSLDYPRIVLCRRTLRKSRGQVIRTDAGVKGTVGARWVKSPAFQWMLLSKQLCLPHANNATECSSPTELATIKWGQRAATKVRLKMEPNCESSSLVWSIVATRKNKARYDWHWVRVKQTQPSQLQLLEGCEHSDNSKNWSGCLASKILLGRRSNTDRSRTTRVCSKKSVVAVTSRKWTTIDRQALPIKTWSAEYRPRRVLHSRFWW